MAIPQCLSASPENANPDAVLRKELIDNRQGLCVWRSAYGNGDEQMLGFYAKHASRWAQTSRCRFFATPSTATTGSSAAKPDKRRIPGVCPEGGQKGDASHGTGWLMLKPPATKHNWAADLRKTSRAYHERWITAHQDGHALSILDLIDEHSERPYHEHHDPGLFRG